MMLPLMYSSFPVLRIKSLKRFILRIRLLEPHLIFNVEIFQDFLSRIVIPCKASQQRNPPVIYYSVPPEVEKSAL